MIVTTMILGEGLGYALGYATPFLVVAFFITLLFLVNRKLISK